MEVKWRKNSHHPKDADPKAVYDWLQDVRSRTGELTTVSVADEAEADPANDVITPWFTWDGELAVRKLHEQEAGVLIRSTVIVKVVPQQKAPVPTFVSIVQDNGRHEYLPTEVVVKLSTEDQIDRLLSDCRQQIAGLVSRLNSLVELIAMIGRQKTDQAKEAEGESEAEDTEEDSEE